VSIHTAIEQGNEALVRQLLSSDPDQLYTIARGGGESPLHTAAWAGEVEIAKLLLAAGADPNARDRDGSTPLHHAARNGPVEGVKLLLDHGAQIQVKNKREYTPLLAAVYSPDLDREDFAQELLNRGAPCDLNSAIRLKMAGRVKELLAKGHEAIENAPFPEELLLDAVFSGSTEMVRLLLEAGLGPEGPHDRSLSPLLVAVELGLNGGNLEPIELLLQYGFDPDIKTISGESLRSKIENFDEFTPMKAQNQLRKSAILKIFGWS